MSQATVAMNELLDQLNVFPGEIVIRRCKSIKENDYLLVVMYPNCRAEVEERVPKSFNGFTVRLEKRTYPTAL